MELKKVKIVLCLTVLLVSTILFYPGQKTEAASSSPSHMQLLIFSHLAYSILDATSSYPRGTSLSKVNFEKDKWVKDFRDAVNDLKKDKVFNKSDTPTSILKRYGILDWQIYNHLYDKKSGFFGIIFYNKKTKQYVVSYRGSNGLADIGDDLKIVKGKYSVQEKKAYELLKTIPNWASNKKKITITGHSLGGFLAQIEAASYKIDAVTFNAPGFDKNDSRYKKLNSKGESDKYVVNYVMTSDYVAEFGKNIGSIKRFEGKLFDNFVKLHSIKSFYKHLQ